MTEKKGLGAFVTLGVFLLLAWGLVRAATSRYQSQRDAVLAQCRAEQSRLGLDRKALFAKYPTPEQMLCQMSRVVPGGTAEVVAKGKFLPGTKFVFENDKVEVIKEALRGTEYRATIKVMQSPGPDYATLQALQPVTCRGVYCQYAVYIGGQYEWNFTADNGWRINLKPLREDLSKEAPQIYYCTEFYRSGEVRPFEVHEAQFGFNGHESYVANIREEGCGAASSTEDTQAEMKRLQEKMMNPAKLSEKEYQQVMERYQQLLMRSMQEQQAKLAKLQDPKYVQEMEKRRKEFGCRVMNFWFKADALEGNILCGEKVGKSGSLGRLELKGTMKLAGP